MANFFIVDSNACNVICDRRVFTNLRDAQQYATRQSKEQIWKISKNKMFFGNAKVVLHTLDFNVPSSHID